MIVETLIVCATCLVLFLPYVHAKAYEIRENARKQEIENDNAELY